MAKSCVRRQLGIYPKTVPGNRGTARVGPPAAPEPGRILHSNLPAPIPVDKRELALWRAFLAEEIEAILCDGD